MSAKAPRVFSVVTNLRCNQSCLWCTRRAEQDDPRFIAPAAVRARIERGLEAGSDEVLLTGGEPGMRRDLEALVHHARESGAKRVVIETNATLIDAERARRLQDAGLDHARVHLPSWGETCDALTRDPGGFERAIAGAKALAAAGVTLEGAIALVRSAAPHLTELPARLREALGDSLRSLVIAVPVESADPRECLSFTEAAAATQALERSARPLGLELRMNPGDLLPPCAFDAVSRARLARLYTMSPGASPLPRHTHAPACTGCVLRDRCSGLSDAYRDRFGLPEMHAVTDERTRRRLALIGSEQEQVTRELVSSTFVPEPGGGATIDETIRVGFRCNQACTFCFVSTHLPAPPTDAVETAIRSAAARDSRITLSGGEPTLDPRLPDWVRLAKSLSRRDVVLQTNAIRLDDPALVRALRDAGLDEVFVSLHGATAEVSDAVTEAPGTWARTVRGIDNLHATPIRLLLNYVVCEKNRHQLVDHVRMVHARWPRARLNLSFVAPSSDLVPRDRGLVPRYSDALPAIAAAVAEARRLGVTVGGFESMCGLPLCLVPEGFGELVTAEIPQGFDGGEFVKADACTRCSLATRCWGVRRGYAETHGTTELRAV